MSKAPFKCFKGCSQCCANVLIYKPEWDRILERLEATVPIQEQTEFIKRSNFSVDGPATATILGPCPLLKDHRCSVYDIRPLNCRNFHCGRRTQEESLDWQNGKCMSDLRRRKEDPEYRDWQVMVWMKNRPHAEAAGVLDGPC